MSTKYNDHPLEQSFREWQKDNRPAPQTAPEKPPRPEPDDPLEAAFWAFDAARKAGGERLAFKDAVRALLRATPAAPPPVAPTDLRARVLAALRPVCGLCDGHDGKPCARCWRAADALCDLLRAAPLPAADPLRERLAALESAARRVLGYIDHVDACAYRVACVEYNKGRGPGPDEEDCDCGVYDLTALLSSTGKEGDATRSRAAAPAQKMEESDA